MAYASTAYVTTRLKHVHRRLHIMALIQHLCLSNLAGVAEVDQGNTLASQCNFYY